MTHSDNIIQEVPTTIQLAIEIIEQDGLNHIRIDNRSLVDLGRMLDSQYIIPFNHPVLGQFNTTEGFWHYISIENPSDLLRVLNGHECRKYIKELKAAKKFTKKLTTNFYEHIQYSNYLKIEASPKLKKMFIESTLPFKMYYVKKGTNGCIINNTSNLHPRLANIIELRNMYHRNPNLVLPTPDCSEILS